MFAFQLSFCYYFFVIQFCNFEVTVAYYGRFRYIYDKACAFSCFQIYTSYAQNMNAKSDKNKRGIRIRRISGNNSRNNNSCHRPWKGDCPNVPEAPHSPVTYFRKLFETEIISDIVDYTNTYALQCDPAKPIVVSANEIWCNFGQMVV